MRTLNVLDAMMGMGKTTAMIRYINELPDDRLVIFCTPLLPQIERVQTECTKRHFVAPSNEFMSKTENIKALIKTDLNIATTHSLFLLFDDEIRELIRERKYTLIVDEAMDVLSIYEISPYDAEDITTNYCEALDDGQLIWVEGAYDGRFEDYRKDIATGTVYKYSSRVLIQMCKIESFEVFEEVFLMTYLFEGHPCKAYFDFNNWNYKQWYVTGSTHETYALSEQPIEYTYPNYSKLITVKHKYNGSQLTTEKSAFSLKWFKEHCEANSMEISLLKRHLATFFRQYGGDGCDNNMWTCFKDYENHLKGARYANGFVPCNSKATNEFRHKTVLAYPINRYMNPNLVNFISSHGGKLKHNDFALTEMVQWVWRSAIRDGKPITIYIPSDRMYDIFTNWLNSLN